MDPEQRLLVIHKYFAVKSNVIIFRTFARVLSPQRMDIADGYRTFYNPDFLLRFALFSLFLLFLDVLNDLIRIKKIFFSDRLVFRLCVRF